MGEFKYECAWCPQRRNCEWAFGKYWDQRSHGAKGCNIGFGELRKVKAEHSSTVKAEAKPAETKPATPPKPIEQPKPTRPTRPGEARQGSLF